ncbi:MAG TPA: hypothetical protein VJX67_23025 [Blastocatellia bacterium]|nr:hypothetical protein [Blastocatellia bacterium]
MAEYGSVFVTRATPPPVVIFRDDREVETFQSSLEASQADVGGYTIKLQKEALTALEAATSEARRAGISITPRAADAAKRTYDETLALWRRNVKRGLEHWTSAGKLTPEEASEVERLAPLEQTSAVLGLEQSREAFFSTFFDKSIIYSVAPPGASQHLSLLAFDVKEYSDNRVDALLTEHGWYRTVTSDLPHFTYLGFEKQTLPDLGLIEAVRKYDSDTYRFWIPDSNLLPVARR